MFYTSLEKSKRLFDLGLDPNTADMCWGIDSETSHYNNSPYPCAWSGYTAKEFYIPCWSVDALIKLLPRSIVDNDSKQFYIRHSDFDHIEYLSGYWNGHYHHKGFSEFAVSQPLIDVLYKCVVWLLENDYIGKTE